VADGESSKKRRRRRRTDELYPEWRQRCLVFYAIVPRAGVRLRLCNFDLVPYASRPFAFCLEGYPEIRGTTDENGFVIVGPRRPRDAHGYVELWPRDEEPDDKVRWDIEVASIFRPEPHSVHRAALRTWTIRRRNRPTK